MPPKNLPRSIGRYEVIDQLGHGGMGVVYRCHDPHIGRSVAIKLLRLSDDGMRERFLQEAQSAGRLKHRNIVTIYDFGEHDGQPFIVMEFVEGVTLAEQIRSEQPLPLARKLEILDELSRGLDYAHDNGVIHRDVKPANVMIDRDGIVKVLDFGIARVAESGLTQVGMMMGTPNYMSPEQVTGRPVDRRSDIFAVGLVSYELLSYRQAFAGETLHEVMNAVTGTEPASLDEVCPGLDPDLVAIVNKAIQKDPAKRYQTLASMASDIRKVRQHIGLRPSAIVDRSDETIAMPPPGTPAPGRTPRAGIRRDLLSKRRADKIDGHLQVAIQKFDAADFAAAIDECEQAALLDPDETRVLELLEKSRAAADSLQIRECLDEARRCLEREEPDQAARLVARALEIDAGSDDARAMEAAVSDFRRRRQYELERQQAMVAALARAQVSLSKGDLESTIRAASEILVHDPTNREAHELTRQALESMEERRQQQQRDRAAQGFADEQRKAFTAGRRQEAIDALRRFTPPHETVTAALVELRSELAAIERRAREEDERRRREEAEAERQRQVQVRWAARQLELARAAVGARQFVDAIEVLHHVRQVSPETLGLAELLDEARAGQAALEAETRRQREVSANLERASTEIDQGHFDAALSLIDAVLLIAPEHAAATARRHEIETAIDAARRQQALDREAEFLIDQAHRRFDAGEHAAAIGMLDSIEPHPLTTRARDELKARFDEIQRRREAEQRTRAEAAREDHERRARAAVLEARGRFAAGDHATAIGLLGQFGPSHPVVSDALVSLRAELATLQQRQRQQQELANRRKEEADRRKEEEEKAAKEAEAGMADARSCLDRDRPVEAIRLLDTLRQQLAARSASRVLRDGVESLLSTARQRLTIQTLVTEAGDYLDRGAASSALRKVDEALVHDPRAAKALELRRTIQAAIAQARVEEQERQRHQREATERALAEQKAREEAVRRERAEREQRARERELEERERQRRTAALAGALGRTRERLRKGDLRRAKKSLIEAMAIDATSAAAADLVRELGAAEHERQERAPGGWSWTATSVRMRAGAVAAAAALVASIGWGISRYHPLAPPGKGTPPLAPSDRGTARSNAGQDVEGSSRGNGEKAQGVGGHEKAPGGGGQEQKPTAAPDGIAAATFPVTIDAVPWADFQVTPLSPTAGSEDIKGTTPWIVRLPAGEYRVRFSNRLASSRVDRTFKVAPGGGYMLPPPTMPGMDADRIVQEILPQ